MSNTKSTKRALFSAVTAMLICVAMLIGTTFAWFTDSASTAVNKIQAGKLDVKLEMQTADGSWVDANGKILTWVRATSTGTELVDSSAILWEPGCTYSLQPIRLRNNGNLALKYKIVISGIQGSAKLNEAIEWTINDTNLAADHPLAAGESNTLTISGHMKEEAGNEYQGKFIDGIAITVVATQDTVEYDSEDNRYDAAAEYPVVANSQDAFAEAVSSATADAPVITVLSAGTYTLPTTSNAMANKDITITGSKDTVIDMKDVATGQNTSNAKLAFEGVKVEFANSNYMGIQHAEKVVYKDCTITGKQFMYANNVEFINCKFVNLTDYCVWTYGAKNITFTDCEFTTGGKAILVYNEQTTSSFVANVTLNNCTFNSDGTIANDKAAVETGSNGGNTETSNKYNITFNGCTINRFAANNSTSAAWGNKNSMDTDHLNVVIDGVDVY